MFAAAGVTDYFDRFLSVEGAGAWKPARQAYAYAAEKCGTPLEAMLLVAVHPWDIEGASAPECTRRGWTGVGRPTRSTSRNQTSWGGPSARWR